MTLDSLPRTWIQAGCGTDVLAVSEHGAPGRRPNIHAHFVGRQREGGLDTLPARAAEANRSTLVADIPFPAPENVAAKRCATGYGLRAHRAYGCEPGGDPGTCLDRPARRGHSRGSGPRRRLSRGGRTWRPATRPSDGRGIRYRTRD